MALRAAILTCACLLAVGCGRDGSHPRPEQTAAAAKFSVVGKQRWDSGAVSFYVLNPATGQICESLFLEPGGTFSDLQPDPKLEAERRKCVPTLPRPVPGK